MKNQDTTNTLFQLAASFVHHTGRHLFLTGKAGTGKTTFLRHIKDTTSKKAVIVAPTGVAAINAGGVTIHSFFQLPIGTFVPDNKRTYGVDSSRAFYDKISLFETLRLNTNKRKLIQDLDLLVIDEVSMVRADMMDAIDTLLRRFRRRPGEPFGGVQVLLIGDLYQLPPVVQNEEWEVLQQYYKSPFFFDSKVIAEAPPIFIELKKIYRQSEGKFIHLLNQVRNNCVTPADLDWLNERYNPSFQSAKNESYITLTSHNYKADAINNQELARLPGKPFQFEAEVKGEFNERAFPADEMLLLKEGAQIMFIKNDKGEDRRYFNGKIGVVSRIEDRKIHIKFPNEHRELELEPEEWRNIRYSYNEEQKRIDEEVLGSFHQYPIRLAWAITIHKSQGLTFEKAIIDAGSSFASGQVYVALSRLTSIEGLVLNSRITPASILCDAEIIDFMHQQQDETSLTDLLQTEQKNFILRTLANSFGWDDLITSFRDHLDEFESKTSVRQSDQIILKEIVNDARNWMRLLHEQKEVAEKFAKTLQQLIAGGETQYARLLERTQAACDYFSKRLKEDLTDAINTHGESILKKKKTKKYQKALTVLHVAVKFKEKQLHQALTLAKGLNEGLDNSLMLQQVDEERKTEIRIEAPKILKEKPKPGESQRLSLELFKGGKSIAEIAEERGLAVGTIEGHLAQFVKTGEMSVYDLVPEEKVKAILPLVEKSDDYQATPIKVALGDDYSYGEIRAVINHCIRNKGVESES